MGVGLCRMAAFEGKAACWEDLGIQQSYKRLGQQQIEVGLEVLPEPVYFLWWLWKERLTYDMSEEQGLSEEQDFVI